MKGFGEKEIDMLLKEAKKARVKGESLTQVFENVAKKTGRAQGSVRNFYYALLGGYKTEKVIDSTLKVSKNIGFTKEEEKKLVKEVFDGVKRGKSVRKTILDLSKGNDKMALRMQNKYRNLVKTSPQLINEVAKEMNVKHEIMRRPQKEDFSIYIKKVSEEIDKLILRIRKNAVETKEDLENENLRLKAENAELKLKLQSNAKQYFSDKKVTV